MNKFSYKQDIWRVLLQKTSLFLRVTILLGPNLYFYNVWRKCVLFSTLDTEKKGSIEAKASDM